MSENLTPYIFSAGVTLGMLSTMLSQWFLKYLDAKMYRRELERSKALAEDILKMKERLDQI